MNIPEGLVMEILSWLPVKSLLRFRCVSKTWCQYLSTESILTKQHLGRSKNRNTGIIVSRSYERDRFYYIEDCESCNGPIIGFEIPPVLARGFRFVNVCNGLVCLTDEYVNVCVWNPLTRDHIILPCPPLPSQFCRESDNGYADNQVEIMYGFGFHEGRHEYKVLRMVSISVFEAFEFNSHVSVYTIGTDSSWRILGDVMDYNINLGKPYTALVNGALHWIAPKARPDIIHHVLVSFDLEGEFFQEIPQPQYIKNDSGDDDEEEEEEYTRCSVGELRGLLCIFNTVSDEKMEIWMMKEYGVVDSWSKHFNIETTDLPLGVANNGEIVLIEDRCQLTLYNPKTRSSRPLKDFGFEVFDSNIYIGSLLSPTMINRTRHSFGCGN